MTRFQYDSSVVVAFLDRWQPETHSFHLAVGKMTVSPTVSPQDVVMLFGLVCMSRDGGHQHHQHMVTGLSCLVRECSSERSRASAVRAVRFVRRRAWTHVDLVATVQHTCFYLIFFHILYVFKTNVTIELCVQEDYMADDAEPGTINKFLEAYLL
jgi:hypothetical protein